MSAYDPALTIEEELRAVRERLHDFQYLAWMVCRRIKDSAGKPDFLSLVLSEIAGLEEALTPRKNGRLE